MPKVKDVLKNEKARWCRMESSKEGFEIRLAGERGIVTHVFTDEEMERLVKVFTRRLERKHKEQETKAWNNELLATMQAIDNSEDVYAIKQKLGFVP